MKSRWRNGENLLAKAPAVTRILQTGPSDRLGRKQEEAALTWKRDYPGWRYEYYDDDRLFEYLLSRSDLSPAVIQPEPIIRSVDIFRYVQLWEYGGLYVDLDFVSLQPMGRCELPIGGVVFGSMATQSGEAEHSVPNAWMYAAQPQHPLWLVVLELASKRLLDDYVERATGPILVGDAISVYRNMSKAEISSLRSRYMGGAETKRLDTGDSSVHILAPDVLYPISWSTGHRNRLIADFRCADALLDEHVMRVPRTSRTRAFTYWDHSWGADPLSFENDDEEGD